MAGVREARFGDPWGRFMLSRPLARGMVETWIGAGGWAYFRGPSGASLGEYARAFRFVEVNVTFYRHPSLFDARRWRRSVPKDFRFAVKAHHSITHTQRLRATRTAESAVARDVAITKALGGDILVLETPSHLLLEREQVRALKDFGALAGKRVRIALEARAYRTKPLPSTVASAVRDIGGIDVVDVSKGDLPRVESDVLYTRLLGKGSQNLWEFTDQELREIDVAARSQESDRMVFAFHGVRMYRDAARFIELRSSGKTPPVTRGRGMRALEEILRPDATFPSTGEDLLRDHGWKVLTMEDGRNVHASDYLRHLPPGPFGSLQEVLMAVPIGPGAP